LEESGIAFALPIGSGPMTVEEAMRRGDELAANAAETLARALSLGATLPT
jgi:hypothetical protein